MINMLNNEQNVQKVLRFALGKLARDDGFCTGAGFIINIIIGEIASPPLADRNKNTFPLAFQFLLVKFNNFQP
jgi:hypothetical protein